jgi:hypothetical protein
VRYEKKRRDNREPTGDGVAILQKKPTIRKEHFPDGQD